MHFRATCHDRYTAVLHVHAIAEECTIVELTSQVHTHESLVLSTALLQPWLKPAGLCCTPQPCIGRLTARVVRRRNGHRCL